MFRIIKRWFLGDPEDIGSGILHKWYPIFLSNFWPPLPPLIRFLPSIIRFFGVILNPPPPLKSDIIYVCSLTISRCCYYQQYGISKALQSQTEISAFFINYLAQQFFFYLRFSYYSLKNMIRCTANCNVFSPKTVLTWKSEGRLDFFVEKNKRTCPFIREVRVFLS